ncbi:MAG: glycerol-3-phosphate 1-O-acyltransferase PlsY [Eubacterium sp.]|nr:glycerol-3-phosphate 1-O-acyltransferase PlsY [Eubacterium sp.]
MITFKFIALIIFSYVLGNISPSTILAKARGLDIKSEGSGNAGTTNALRVLGAKAALITLVIDIGKGFMAVFVSGLFLGQMQCSFCALAVFLGHVWPVLIKFKGGKGVATAFGAILAVNWKLALICLLIVVLIVLLTRMVSLGSVSAAIAFPFLAFFLEKEFMIPGLIMAAVLLYKHKGNIQRILKGEENKISFRRKESKGEQN